MNEEGLVTVADEVRSIGVQALTARIDLSRREEISAGVRSLIEEFKTIDILVNNAGVAFYGPTHTMTADGGTGCLESICWPHSNHTRTIADSA